MYDIQSILKFLNLKQYHTLKGIYRLNQRYFELSLKSVIIKSSQKYF